MRGPTLPFALCAAGLLLPAVAAGEPRCAGGDGSDGSSDGPWVLLQLGAQGWSDAQRAAVLSDLQHTLAGRGIAACSGDAHPATTAPLATLTVDLSPDDTARATVDIEVRDAVTHKRVRRDVDLSRIPDDGRPAAIAIEADELLGASWAEIALDTARARQAQENARPQVVTTVGQLLAPAQVESGGLGARAAIEHYLGGVTLIGADAVGRLRLSPRIALEIAGAVRFGPAAAAPHGEVSALATGGGLALLVRVAGNRRAALEAGAGADAAWLTFRAQPSTGAEAAAYGNVLAALRLRLVGRLALGRSLHATAGLNGAVALRGVEATDAGEVVARARGLALGATVGLEAP